MACCSNNCNCNCNNFSSACALKDIIDNLGNLNSKDLCTLKCVINRLLDCDD